MTPFWQSTSYSCIESEPSGAFHLEAPDQEGVGKLDDSPELVDDGDDHENAAKAGGSDDAADGVVL